MAKQYMSYERESTKALASEVTDLDEQINELDQLAVEIRDDINAHEHKHKADRIWKVNARLQDLQSNMQMVLLDRYIRVNALDDGSDDFDACEVLDSDEFAQWIKRHAESNK